MGRAGWPPAAARRAASVACLGLALSGCAHFGPGGGRLPPGQALTPEERRNAILRAEVWSPTDIPSLDLKLGPDPERGFSRDEWTTCEYRDRKLSGRTPKFACEARPGDEVKVKYGPRNGEVFGEVLATRLFWALGFAADRMYPVRVRCRGCPTDPWHGREKAGEVAEFDPAAIERKLPGRAMETRENSGWKWSELELIGSGAGPEARARRDALKLLAAFVQHTDNKAAQQRLLCPPAEQVGRTGCRRPVLMVSDLGRTFGSANLLNADAKSSVKFVRWSRTPVWKDPGRCVAQLGRSFTGTLRNPRIGEAGRAFLAGLLLQLSDAQIRDLFEIARVERRPRDASEDGPPASVDEWAAAFKRKRAAIADHRCPQ